jgi:hypothetical protein
MRFPLVEDCSAQSFSLFSCFCLLLLRAAAHRLVRRSVSSLRPLQGNDAEAGGSEAGSALPTRTAALPLDRRCSTHLLLVAVLCLTAAFVPVPRIDEQFGSSGATAKVSTAPSHGLTVGVPACRLRLSRCLLQLSSLTACLCLLLLPLCGQLEVLRTWPRESAAVSRYTLIDVNRAEANQPIELVCLGCWAALQLDKYDVLIISGARTERVEAETGAAGAVEPVDCEFRLLVDDRSESASIIVYGWRDRILARPGKLHTTISIKQSNAAAAAQQQHSSGSIAATRP